MEALGLIETRGFVAAVVAADAATKAADVRLHAYDLIDGGLVTVHLRGEVAAVRAAVEAGSAAAQGVGRVVAEHVIPRLHAEGEMLVPPPAGMYKPLLRPAPAGTQPAYEPLAQAKPAGEPKGES